MAHRMSTRGRVFKRGQGILLLAGSLAALACNQKLNKDRPATVQRARLAEPAPELTEEFLKRAHSALLERVGSQAELLEMRAQGRQLSYIVQLGGRLKQIDYVEAGSLGEARGTKPGGPGATAVSPVGTILGPDEVQQVGDGPVPENLFPLKDVNIAGIAQSFSVAVHAIDPQFGRVSAVTVRRFLPFSTGVRARIYVDSPTLPGSIDTSERGIPLKQW